MYIFGLGKRVSSSSSQFFILKVRKGGVRGCEFEGGLASSKRHNQNTNNSYAYKPISGKLARTSRRCISAPLVHSPVRWHGRVVYVYFKGGENIRNLGIPWLCYTYRSHFHVGGTTISRGMCESVYRSGQKMSGPVAPKATTWFCERGKEGAGDNAW